MSNFYETVQSSADYILSHCPLRPTCGVVLGSGLGGLVDSMEDKTVLPYADIPHFPRSTVAGHAGNLVIGRLTGQTVAALQGRFHYYEGFTMRQVTYPMYVLKLLGVQTLLLTNACGGIDRTLQPGDLMLLTDHINMLGANSLIGENDERFGPRFPDMTEVYSLRLRDLAKAAARELDHRYFCGITDEMRAADRKALCSVDAALLKAQAAALSDVLSGGVRVAFGSKDAVESAKDLFDRVETL